MARFIYRKDQLSADQLRAQLPYQSETLNAKLAAAEAQLDALKSLLDETREQRDRWQSQAERVSQFVSAQQDLRKAG